MRKGTWRLLGTLLRGRRRGLTLLGLVLAVSSALPLAGPQVLRAFIDRAVAGQPVAALSLIAGVYVAVAVARQTLTVTVAYGATRLAWMVTNDLRGLVLRHALDLDLSYHATHPPGELIERTDGDPTALSTFVSSLVVVLWEDWRIGLGPPRSAYVPQVPRLFSESLQDNVALGSDLAIVDLNGALRTAVLEPDIDRMPDGPATLIGPRGVRLSGGQVQRVATARAVARHPDLLVFDDVSSALDLATERTLWHRLLTRRSATLLVVSNRPDTIARADQLVTIEHGRVAAVTIRDAPQPHRATVRPERTPGLTRAAAAERSYDT